MGRIVVREDADPHRDAPARRPSGGDGYQADPDSVKPVVRSGAGEDAARLEEAPGLAWFGVRGGSRSGNHRVVQPMVPSPTEQRESPAGSLTLPRAWKWAGPVVFAVVLVGTVPSLPHRVINWDNELKLHVARNLVQGRGLVVTETTKDDATYVLPGLEGRRYPPYPPLAYALPLVTLAAEPLLGGLCEGAATLLVLALLGWALVAWGRAAGVSLQASVTGALLVTLGTVLWPMAALGYDVLVEALALALILRAGTAEATGRLWVVAGLAFGSAIGIRLGASVLGFSAAVLLLTQRPSEVRAFVWRVLAFGLGMLPGVGLVLWFNWLRFGSPMTFFEPLAGAAAASLNMPWGSTGQLEGMAGLLVSPGKGLLWYAPPLIAVLAAAVQLARCFGPTMAALGAQLVATVLVFGRFRYWHGDWAWGPRYVSALCVAAAPLAWWLVDRATTPEWRRKWRIPAAVTALIALQAFPVVGNPVGQHFRFTLTPLEATGRLVTRPVTRPPEPGDFGVHYYQPANSPFVSLARGFGDALRDPHRGLSVAGDLAKAAVAPLLALGLLAGLRTRAQGP